MNEDVLALLHAAWDAYGEGDPIRGVLETSAGVSTNRVYRLELGSGSSVFAKLSSYGSFAHFRQDHVRVHQWSEQLAGTRYARFLAPVLLKGGRVFTYVGEGAWVVFYGEAERRGVLPRVLSERQIENLGAEVALFHRTCAGSAEQLDPTWQAMGADMATLYDRTKSAAAWAARGYAPEHASLVRQHCDLFFERAEALGYHRMPKLPVLTDWNRGNFSVAYDETGFRLFSRWDYDWFRIEPRTLDFYFFSRVVREEGDQTVFSYTVSPLLEPRFRRFVRAYHAVYPLTERELAFAGEAYRFFLLNYVIRTGQHFFAPQFFERLARETLTRYLSELEQTDFSPLLACLAG